MPFVTSGRPSIQLGLLKAVAQGHGFPTRTFHFTLDAAQALGVRLYEAVCDMPRALLLGEWLFSPAAFGPTAPDPEGEFVRPGRRTGRMVDWDVASPEELMHLRDCVLPDYLDRLIEQVDWAAFDVVGFTSTFQQNAASLALARRVKVAAAHVVTVFGGANCDHPMGAELLRSMPCIDYVISGEGDDSFPEFLSALREGADPGQVPGVLRRIDGVVVGAPPRPPSVALEQSPIPDYEEYFERAEALGLLPLAGRRDVPLPFETARGCWWGQKHHCTFCGLNGTSMRFRSKSPERVRDELNVLVRRHGSFRLDAVDNILDAGYLRALLPQLADRSTDYDLFYEVKSNLRRDQLRLFKQAGLRRIQPGIESLNSRVLALMHKGVTGIQNVNLLRWGRYYQLDVAWNLLYGFPGEREEDYQEQAEILRRIRHLQPPDGPSRVWMERFSPMFGDRDTFPTRFLRPMAAYRSVYPEGVDLDELAYFFDYEFEDVVADGVLTPTREIVDDWRSAWASVPRPGLDYRFTDGLVQIEDRRNAEGQGTYTFEGTLALLYQELSERPRSAASLSTELDLPWPTGEIEEALDEFCRLGLMMRDGRQFLSLALPATRGR
jgi:ribosomal peptide maturation radical SAM protein 1